MAEIVAILLRNNYFITEMLVILLLSGIKFAKRKYFWLRFLAAFIAVHLVSYFAPKLVALIVPSGINEVVDVIRAVINCVIQLALLFGLLYFCYDIRKQIVMFMLVCAYLLQHISYCINVLIFTEVFLESWLFYLKNFTIVFIVYSVFWLLFWRKMTDKVVRHVNFGQIMPCIITILIVCIISNNIDFDKSLGRRVLMVTDMICCILCLICQYAIFSISALKDDKQKIGELLQQSQQQYLIFKQNIELINIQCHDLRHQLSRLENNVDTQYIAQLKHIVDEYDCVIRVGNPVLDILLTEKGLRCRENGIEFTCIVDGSCMPKIDECDVYALFGNVLDNAIEALECVEAKEKKFISVKMFVVNSLFCAHIENYAPKKIVFSQGLPQTTKSDDFNHGFGAKSIRMICRKYSGEVTFRQNDDIFHTNIVLPI